jgi:hypothetical protein
LPAQPVDATPPNQLIQQCFPSRIDLHGVLNQNLNRAFVLFELTQANEIRLVDACQKTLTKCCIDPLIETTPVYQKDLAASPFSSLVVPFTLELFEANLRVMFFHRRE